MSEISQLSSADRYIGDAFVTLVMNGGRYIPGAIALAHSLRLTQTRHRIVCMIDETIQGGDYSKLAWHFDEIVLVKKITDPETLPMITPKQQERYSSWINSSYTKWACLSLTQYRRVCFMDADNIVLRNIDHIFDHSPAACFRPFIPQGRAGNILKNPYPENPKLGSTVDLIHIKMSLRYRGMVAGGSVVVLPTGRFNEYVNYIESGEFRKFHATTECLSGPDEISIVAFMMRYGYNWKHLPYTYSVVPWRNNGLKPEQYMIITYTGSEKPWEQDNWEDQIYYKRVAESAEQYRRACEQHNRTQIE